MADEFQAFVADQLSRIPGLIFKRMFGGVGVYSEGRFFAILYQGRLYLKTDEETRLAYISVGMGPFQPNEKQTLKSYYEVPVAVLEDAIELTRWAQQAINCAGSG